MPEFKNPTLKELYACDFFIEEEIVSLVENYLEPKMSKSEILDMGVLGNINEPFLQKALSLITGVNAKLESKKSSKLLNFNIEPIADSKDFTPLGKGMYKKLNIID